MKEIYDVRKDYQQLVSDIGQLDFEILTGEKEGPSNKNSGKDDLINIIKTCQEEIITLYKKGLMTRGKMFNRHGFLESYYNRLLPKYSVSLTPSELLTQVFGSPAEYYKQNP